MSFFSLETRANTRWNMIRTVTDAKVAFETVFHIVTQDRRQQCYKYNELKVSIYACMYHYKRARTRVRTHTERERERV